MYNYEKESEQVLIRRAKRGDVKAFSELYARIYIELYKFALYTLKHSQDAEDAVSETVISAYESISGLRREESFRSWIFTILSNQCRRRFSRAENTEELHEELPEEETDYAQNYDIRTAFGILEEEERMIISLSLFGGYRSAEIGEMMNLNPATVRSKKTRAYGRLRKILKQEGA